MNINMNNIFSRFNLSPDRLTNGIDWSGMDKAFRRVLILSKLFTSSWGHPQTLKELALFKRECTSQRGMADFNREYSVKVEISKEVRKEGIRLLDASFIPPYALRFPNHCPPPINRSYFRMVIPPKAHSLCIHLSGTGDHSFWRRDHLLAKPLLHEGIASILICTPFYGDRKPKDQFRSSLQHVSDLFVMGGSLISECLYLTEWSREQFGLNRVAISGISMGGFMASLAASNVPFPIACVPCLSATNAGPSYTNGALRDAIGWMQLEKELKDRDYVRALDSIPHSHWISRAHEQQKENGQSLAYNMMLVVMDEFTSLARYPVPVFPSACKAVNADKDAYIVQSGISSLDQLWPGAETRTVMGGHVSAYFQHHDQFRSAISDALKTLP